ncbi:hypothetical protein BJ508DRAFT_409860 [Ascobolus immersus RN42]|uniref:Uncharacterized protein n=1 Tax=Ascobolus immersus RN42 TaxID=1160509 RepID=A0A3N4IUK4_ASCIM|nr:hypothetical protein BJ508DRAFT_409860 [Ascobolus immersus RN42]
MTLPMVVFSGLLLGLIFYYRVVPNKSSSSTLALPTQQYDDFLLVKISSTTLISVASWSSTVAPILVGFAVTLISYPVARSLMTAVMDNNPEGLPTPYQLGLMLRMLATSGFGTVWTWLVYSVGWKKGINRQKQPKPMRIMTSVLMLGLVVSLFIFATDTWLHFTTKMANVLTVSETDAQFNASFVLRDGCLGENAPDTPYAKGCTINTAVTATFNMDGKTALKLLYNTSSTMSISSYESENSNYVYYAVASQPALANVDYSARTWGLRTRCKASNSICEVDTSVGSGTRFSCGPTFFGVLGDADLIMAYFTDAEMSSNITIATNLENPYYFGLAVSTNEETPTRSKLSEGRHPEVARAMHGADVFVLLCEATVHDIQYSSVNNTVSRFQVQKSNRTLANILQGAQQYSAKAGNVVLTQAASTALMYDEIEALERSMATAYSRVALSIAIGAFDMAPPLEKQRHDTILVAKVPKIPLAALLLGNLLMALLGIILTITAMLAVNGNPETGEVQARLSIPGLVADRFEGEGARQGVQNIEDMFLERNGRRDVRVGVLKTSEGGYSWGAWMPM